MLGGNAGGVAAEIRAKVEEKLKVIFEEQHTFTQEITVDGAIIPDAWVVWVERHRSGQTTVVFNGQTYSVPFTFPTGADLKLTSTQPDTGTPANGTHDLRRR